VAASSLTRAVYAGTPLVRNGTRRVPYPTVPGPAVAKVIVEGQSEISHIKARNRPQRPSKGQNTLWRSP
jgi:hypothetical protein